MTLRPLASTWSRPPEPMSYAQPSPPTIQTLRRTRWSTTLSRSATAGPSSPSRRCISSATRSRCARSSDSRSCGASRISLDELRADSVAQLAETSSGEVGVAVGRQPEAEPELGVVLEERVRPGRPAPLGIGRPRRRRQVAAVDRRAAGRVRDHQPVAEELREQLDVGRLAAAGAGAGELEQRLEELGAAHGAEVDARAVARRKRLEEGDVRPRRLERAARAARG